MKEPLNYRKFITPPKFKIGDIVITDWSELIRIKEYPNLKQEHITAIIQITEILDFYDIFDDSKNSTYEYKGIILDCSIESKIGLIVSKIESQFELLEAADGESGRKQKIN